MIRLQFLMLNRCYEFCVEFPTGKLKPGYKYTKGGIVKVKAKAKTTKKKRSTNRKTSRKKAFKLFK